MNSERDFERTAAEWLDAGSDATPSRVIDAVLLAVRTMPQERDFGIPLRTLLMKRALYAAAIALVAIAGAAAFYAFGRGPNVGAEPTPSPSMAATHAPSAEATPNSSPIDVTGWTTYRSDTYGFSISHPADWNEVPATHVWTFEGDGDNWLSSGQEAFFTSVGEGIRVSAWTVPLDPTRTADPSREEVATWVEDYCQRTGNSPCSGIVERSTELCVERRDCHPGLLVPFDNDVQAFFTGGNYRNMVIVALWYAESDPAVASYGGATRLLEGFLLTMGVCDGGTGFESRPANC